jgi:hypothetical protein
MGAAKLETFGHGGARKKTQDANLHLDRKTAAAMLQISERTVAHAATVLKHGTPELQKAVERGETSVSAAAKQVQEQENVKGHITEIEAKVRGWLEKLDKKERKAKGLDPPFDELKTLHPVKLLEQYEQARLAEEACIQREAAAKTERERAERTAAKPEPAPEQRGGEPDAVDQPGDNERDKGDQDHEQREQAQPQPQPRQPSGPAEPASGPAPAPTPEPAPPHQRPRPPKSARRPLTRSQTGSCTMSGRGLRSTSMPVPGRLGQT